MPLFMSKRDREREEAEEMRESLENNPHVRLAEPIREPEPSSVEVVRDGPRGPGRYVVHKPSDAFLYKQQVSAILREYLNDELAIARLSNRLYEIRPK